MNRRSFLQKAGLVGVLSTAVAPARAKALPASFERDGWRIQWHDYERMNSQRIWIGYWTADRVGDESGAFWYCTTMGQCWDAGRFFALDLSCSNEWPVIDGTHTPRQAELVKRAALVRLMEHLS